VILGLKTAASRKLSLEAQCFLLRDGELHRLEMQSEFFPSGAVKMKGSLGRDLRSGKWTLWTVVGRRGELPDPADLRSLLARGEVRQRNWMALPADILIHPRSP
jgi:hypothetical protein